MHIGFEFGQAGRNNLWTNFEERGKPFRIFVITALGCAAERCDKRLITDQCLIYQRGVHPEQQILIEGEILSCGEFRLVCRHNAPNTLVHPVDTL